MRYVVVTALSMLLASVVPVAASDKDHAQHMDEQAMMEEMIKLATPGAPHAHLMALAGSWTVKAKEWMAPGAPPTESTGTVEMRSLLGGRFLQQDFTGTMMGQPYQGHGITGYDNHRKKYVSIWMDSMSTAPFIMEGAASADGKTITLHGSHDMPGGGSMTHRAVWISPDANHQTFEMYGAHGQEKEEKEMELVYTRKP